jgi:flagellar biosynthetic protein FliP
MNAGNVVVHDPRLPSAERGSRTGTFIRHLLEMTLVMMLGMCVLGMAFRAIHVALFGTGFDDAWHEHTELTVFAMTFNMTLPMVLWMRHRGHSWRRCGEMAAAMFILAFALLLLFWVGALSAQAVLPLEMALMIPAMVVVMLLHFDEYAGGSGSAGPAVERPVHAAT